jgi:hypothetical protein
MKKINFIIMLALVLSFASGISVQASDVDRNVPKVKIEQPEVLPEAQAGKSFNISITYKNESDSNAYDLTITPVFDDVPLVYEKPVEFKRTSILRARKSDVYSFSLKIADNAKLGTYALKFKLEYTNVHDESFKSEQQVYFKITKEMVKPILNITNISTGDSAIAAGKGFPLSFTITNRGEVDANNVEVTLKNMSMDGFMAVDSNDYKFVGDLKSGASVQVKFDMFASKKIAKGPNSISVEIKCKDTSNTEMTTEKTIYVANVLSENEVQDEDPTSGKPKIIIASYSTNPASIVAGVKFNFNFTFKNTSKDRKLRNMKITLSSSEGAFIITKGSNTFYVEDVAALESVSKNIELRAKQDLASNSYPLIINFDYEDYNGNEYSTSETINIPVTEYSKLEINSVYANEAMLGSNTSLSFSYINMGKATVSNLTASVEGDYTSVQPINYIGNCTAGTSDYYDIEVTPTKSGTNYGTLILSFEDSSGSIIEVKKDFEGFAMEMPSVDPSVDPSNPGGIDNPSMPTEPEEKIPTWIIIVSGIGTLIVTYFITRIITTKIVRKKLEDEI